MTNHNAMLDLHASVVPKATPARHEALRRCQEVLVNCYCREVASPESNIRVRHRQDHSVYPLSFLMGLQHSGAHAVEIILPRTGARVLAAVETLSVTSNYRYKGAFYHQVAGQGWALSDWRSLSSLLIRELGERFGQENHVELTEQIKNSVSVTTAILETPPTPFLHTDSVATYIDSEQGLLLGHPFHPTPKSRIGFSAEDVERYSPELRASFPLHYFAVRRDAIVQASVLDETCDAIVRSNAPADLDPGSDFALVPLHPWQARYLSGLSSVQAAMAQHTLRDLGCHGARYFPTSSIRTVYCPDNPYFYKFSLNVRVTNCLRKNSEYELEGSIFVTRAMRALAEDLRCRFPDLSVLAEPAVMTVNLPCESEEERRSVSDGFGLILREGIRLPTAAGTATVLAGALFGADRPSRARLHGFVRMHAARCGLSADAATESWLAAYVERLVPPVLYCFFEHGVIFEPHQQNVVLTIADGCPAQVILRDFEGVKLVSARFVACPLSELSPHALRAMTYSDAHGWQRIAYCLFVNNLCEVIGAISADRPHLERRLWSVVAECLEVYEQRYGTPRSALRTEALLGGVALPAKANLLTRFLRRPDRDATYVPMQNPMAQATRLGEVPPWN